MENHCSRSESPDDPVIAVEGLTSRFGEATILDHVNLKVFRGEILCIVGGSGCGKSTLLKQMIGLLHPDAGRILVDGEDIAAVSAERLNRIRRGIGVLFQSDALFGSMTLGENVALPLSAFPGVSAESATRIVRMKLGMVNLAGYENHYPAELSGGMRKRGGLARAMALDPQILFFRRTFGGSRSDQFGGAGNADPRDQRFARNDDGDRQPSGRLGPPRCPPDPDARPRRQGDYRSGVAGRAPGRINRSAGPEFPLPG